MKFSTRTQARGIFRIFRGTMKTIGARITADRMLGVKGRLDRFNGKLQWQFGKGAGMIGL